MEVISYELLFYGLFIGLIGGAIGGTLAGLAGIGGGLIYVPLFYLTMPGDQNGLSMHIMASLVAVAMTGFFSARAHWRLGHLHKRSLKRLLPGLMIGAAMGLWSTLQAPAVLILFALACLNGWVSWDLGRGHQVKKTTPLAWMSGPIGYMSGTLGVGGGTMLVPLLRRTVSLREAVGTSATCGMLMAVAAVLFNLMLEPTWRSMISEQLNFLIGAWFGILLMIPKASGWSAYLYTKATETMMQTVLKALFFVLSLLFFLATVIALA